MRPTPNSMAMRRHHPTFPIFHHSVIPFTMEFDKTHATDYTKAGGGEEVDVVRG